MRFVVIQPSWDHTEVLGSFFYFIKQSNNQANIIYNWDRPEGNYINYFCNLFDIHDKVNFINYKSPKKHISDLKKAHKIIFIDEVHLQKFMSKNIFRSFSHKIFVFNHLTKRIPYEITSLSLGPVPYNRCINEKKSLINNYFNPNVNIKKNMNKIKKFLIVGNSNFRNIQLLDTITDFDIQIYFVDRTDIIINNSKVKILKSISTEDLVKILENIDFIITLFNKNSVYHKNRISGIIPYAISFGKPIIMDEEFYNLTNTITNEKFIYKNNLISFKNTIKNVLEITDNFYEKIVNKIIKYRDTKIMEQYLNFHLIFK